MRISRQDKIKTEFGNAGYNSAGTRQYALMNKGGRVMTSVNYDKLVKELKNMEAKNE